MIEVWERDMVGRWYGPLLSSQPYLVPRPLSLSHSQTFTVTPTHISFPDLYHCPIPRPLLSSQPYLVPRPLSLSHFQTFTVIPTHISFPDLYHCPIPRPLPSSLASSYTHTHTGYILQGHFPTLQSQSALLGG